MAHAPELKVSVTEIEQVRELIKVAKTLIRRAQKLNASTYAIDGHDFRALSLAAGRFQERP